MKKSLALILAVVMILCIALAGCTGEADNGKKATEMTICVGPYPDTIDPALNSAVDGGTYIIHTFSGLVGYEQDADGNLKLVPACAKELPEAVDAGDGKVSYTFTLKDDLKWSDGSALTAEDFVYAWNRAINPDTAADYEYMFEVVDGYADGALNVTASEDGKQLTVVLTTDVPYFFELCAFPTYMPVKKDVVEGNEGWATAAETYIGNGAYKVTEFSQSQMVMEKNEYYFDADSIKADKIIWPFNDDDSSLLANFKNGSYQFIDSVPNDEIKNLEAQYPDEYFVTGQLGTYYVCFNVNDPALSDFSQAEKKDIRDALGLLLDRNYICEEIGQAGQVPADSFVPMGLTQPDGSEFRSTNGVNGDGAGYYSVKAEDYESNCAKAVEILKGVAESSGKFTVDAEGTLTGFPTLTYITNQGSGHEAIATYIQGVFATYGITLKIEVQEWATFLNTRKDGNYSIARNGWLSDYNDPISFLDMWITASGNNDVQFGRGDHAEYAGYSYDGQDNLTWADSYDKLIAKVKTSKDANERFTLMHEAENILMSTGAICPIYYYTDLYMCSSSINGFFASPLGFKYFMYATAE